LLLVSKGFRDAFRQRLLADDRLYVHFNNSMGYYCSAEGWVEFTDKNLRQGLQRRSWLIAIHE
jgi:hypothetical protein